MKKTSAYVIEYKINGECHTTIECPIKGWENQFLQQVLNRIESIVNGGAVITALHEVHEF